ncbi:hydroxyisourate hydrolase [Halalkalibacter krulwichiae]|uniref:5-hydroxyisourate hydrolase n=1 Tax=Halalkalibacter krulwichiae TaxID=199441 RepID=A0A1X9M672_9BACI|nr:hydroxyisourate hydrolase [Halalkalibacter krulwichiae]ARK28939.1 5-hydroxyisourate hydrolase [Halalkalibacter krulwichiae]
MAGQLTTHVLDMSRGVPAENVYVVLRKLKECGQLHKVAAGQTNSNGRLDQPLIAGASMQKGIYQLQFHIGNYFEKFPMGDSPFLDLVPIQFSISNESEHYHVPLLIAPGGYSTYRGS